MLLAGVRRVGIVEGYTIVNLKEVEDQAPRFGLSPNVESRFATVPLELENSGISYQRLAPGFRRPFGHRHRLQEEIYVVVGGSARVKLDDEVQELKRWDAVRVPPRTVRQFEAGSREPRSSRSAHRTRVPPWLPTPSRFRTGGRADLVRAPRG
jgi:mannose-6-phosphate isomerase-like protein (cupin superfamily)